MQAAVRLADAGNDEDDVQRCRLEHRLFQLMENPIFRRAENDHQPVVIVAMGDSEAAIPLASLQRELNIAAESEDGRMLALIAEALGYVPGLRIGDPLPAEVLTGEASWEPEARHSAVAMERLRAQLVGWIRRTGGLPQPGPGDGPQDAGQAKRTIQIAFDETARRLGLDDREEVVRRLEALAGELAYIEALRDWLLRRMRHMAGVLDSLGKSWRGDLTHTEMLNQVQRLMRLGVQQVGQRFADLDAESTDILGALRDPEAHALSIRASRDWLYRSWRAWQPLLDDWTVPVSLLNDGAWTLMGRTYRFLAARFTPVTEWVSIHSPGRRRRKLEGMVW